MPEAPGDGRTRRRTLTTLDEERITRNWNELLQELRVTQTGVQIMSGFLLTVPFSARFEELEPLQVRVYLAVLSGSILTTGFVLAPAAFHRVLFRHRQRVWLVASANACALTGLALLALTSAGALFLVFDIAVGTGAAIAVFAVALLFFSALWVAFPWSRRRRLPSAP